MASKAKDYDSIPQISGEGQEKEEQDMDYEDALNAQPVSRRQWLVVCICGLGNATDAIEVLSMSYILPVLDLPEQEKGLLSSAVFVGMLAGAVLAGFVADKHGRKPVLIVSMLFNAACTLAFSLTYNVYALAILRFFTGCGVGGAVPVVFSLASEVMPLRLRGASVCIVASFWMLGSIGVALAAWAIIPDLGWRTFAALCSLPAFVCAGAALSVVVESPRFILAQGRNAEATDALLRLTSADSVLMTKRTGHFALGPLGEASLGQEGHGRKASAVERMRELVSPALLRVTVLLCFITACLSFGWYGLVMWMPSLFKSRGVDMCVGTTSGSVDCTYQSSLVATAATLPGNLLSFLVIDRLSHKAVLTVAGGLSALAALWGLISSHAWQLGAAYCAFQACSAVSWNALDVLCTESFPTSTRSTSMGLLSSIGRIAAIVSQVLFASPAFAPPSALPILSALLAVLLSSLSALLLPSEPCHE